MWLGSFLRISERFNQCLAILFNLSIAAASLLSDSQRGSGRALPAFFYLYYCKFGKDPFLCRQAGVFLDVTFIAMCIHSVMDMIALSILILHKYDMFDRYLFT